MGNYVLDLDKQHEKYLVVLQDAKWNLKKKRYYELKKRGIKQPPLRWGRRKKLYPTKYLYNMNNFQDVVAANFLWVSHLWSYNRKTSPSAPEYPLYQTRLMALFPNLLGYPIKKSNSSLYEFNCSIYMPHFHEPSYVQKHEFCVYMNDGTWEA